MAYIVEITYDDSKTEIVPIWSSAFLQEIYTIEKDNPGLMYYKVLVKDPDEATCKYYDKQVKRTIYNLPKQFKPNREGKRNERKV